MIANLTCPHCHEPFSSAPVPTWYDELGINTPEFIVADAWRVAFGIPEDVALEKALAVAMWHEERGKGDRWRQWKRWCVKWKREQPKKQSRY